MNDDIRRRAAEIEAEGRATAAKIAAEQRAATAALQTMRSRLQRIADTLPEARYLGEIGIVPASHPALLGDDDYGWHYIGEDWWRSPYLAVGRLGKATHNPYAQTWNFRAKYDQRQTDAEMEEEFRKALAWWIVHDYPEAKRRADDLADYEAQRQRNAESGCAVFLIPFVGIATFLLFQAGRSL